MKKKKLVSIFLIVIISLIVLLAACEKDNEIIIDGQEETILKNYAFNSSFDAGVSATTGLFNLRLPISLFDGKAISVSGEGLDDITHRISAYDIRNKIKIDKIPNARLIPFFLYIYPLENFDKNVALRKITQVNMEDGSILNCEIRLHTIPYENELDDRFGNYATQNCYDNFDGGNSYETESTLSTMYLGTNFDSITIKRVYFAYGNLTFNGKFELFETDYVKNIKVPNILIPNTENLNYIIKNDGAVWFDFNVKAVDNSKEILTDSMMIDYTLSNDPNHVYSVVSNCISFINFDSK